MYNSKTFRCGVKNNKHNKFNARIPFPSPPQIGAGKEKEGKRFGRGSFI